MGATVIWRDTRGCGSAVTGVNTCWVSAIEHLQEEPPGKEANGEPSLKSVYRMVLMSQPSLTNSVMLCLSLSALCFYFSFKGIMKW